MIALLTPLLLTLGPVALLVVMAIVFAETGLMVGFVLPGDTLLFTVGVLAAAGILHLPVWVAVGGIFLAAAYNLAGAAAWSALVVGAGYFLGGVPLVAAHVELVALALVAASLVPVVVGWGVRRRRRRSRREPEAGAVLLAPEPLLV